MTIETVLKSFKFSPDHITNEQLNPGDERDFPDDILPGLRAAGLVTDSTAPEVPVPGRKSAKGAAAATGGSPVDAGGKTPPAGGSAASGGSGADSEPKTS
jgi:hypothetical protein